jgi:DNA mismatch repair protein MutL
MGQIKVLDQNMVNMIAAGEVIERPASVVKELMENSIDAGATKITIAVEDGGRKLISVTDNGCGMDAEDLAAAFEPHATSKVKTTKDLHGISTFGFRGEALASIASVAQIKAISKTKDALTGNCIEIDCGDKTAVTPCSADYGTTIQVRYLFYKLPARRKFLKTANTEMTHIIEHFTHISLACNNLDLTLIHNGKELYRMSAGQSSRQRIAQLFSSEIAENLIEAENSEKNLHLLALFGRPGFSKTNSSFQYIFLNGRFIHDKFISHAIKEAYRGTLEQNRFPVVFLFIQMPYDNYDVNVHPTKIEVRFYNANLIHSQILAALRERLLAIDAETPAKLPTPIPIKEQPIKSTTSYRSQRIVDAMAEFFKKHRPVQTQQQFGFRQAPLAARNLPDEEATRYAIPDTQYEKKFIQIHDSFIVAQTDDGFIIVDQHALHERTIYEDLRGRIQKNKLESQKLLMPESFEVTDAQADTLKNNTELIEKLGIELAPFGPKTLAVHAFPVILAKVPPTDFALDLIDLLTDKTTELDAETLLDQVLNMAACKAAIKAGTKLTNSEIEQLLANRKYLEHAGRCPHGRPTAIKFTLAELERQFGRK